MTAQRRCIKCKQIMVPKMVEEVEVDYCPDCHGLWLDRGEIRQLALKNEEALSDLRHLVQEGASDQPAPSTVQQPCPACDSKLAFALVGQIVLEHCTICGGIFLDHGELDKAMAVTMERGSVAATIVALARTVATGGTIGE
jgi:Zn-finger nucleic acid-binding protein